MEKTTMRAKTDYVKLEYQILDLVEYNGLKITGNMKILLSLIYSYEKKSRTYYESITTLGKRVGLEPQAARSLVSKLCDAGMISYEERKGSSHIFHSKPLNQELMTLIGDEKPKKSSKATNKKSEEKQENGNGHEQAETPQAKLAATAATPSTDAPAGTPAGQSPDLAPESSEVVAEQRYSVACNDDRSSDDHTAGNHAMSQEAQDDDPTFTPEKPAPEETAGRVIASLDDLRCWSEVGSGEGMDEYGVMWGVESTALYNLIDEHRQIREAEAEKNFKSQRTH
ncbi:TPA: hypothetical protein N3414_004380 [Klebsiella quasipneumoniae subsp. quasipneumoniae]|nr:MULTISPECIES: hypothetical protein [Enterobacteriaceae]MCI4449459.1 hypothetical protein [Klebsiella variicola]HBR1695794.1 hypothetical protein [Klebsiella quasipneumoniae subsp. quasipneumoniae]MCK6825079.1 hypothetical protein [Enterobacter kobei]MCR1229843.1 hypothetical protein [Klebsiella quasipneumoniae]WLP45490.1 hypothetical protein Q7A27_23110 [Raoultella ornithinolytica]